MRFPPTTKGQDTLPTDGQAVIPHHAADLDDMARQLEASGNYRVLRRLVPRPPTPFLARTAGKTGIIIAHNASFDRGFAERAWPIFEHKHWACSMTEIDWKQFGFAGTKLEYLLAGAALFHGAHRAIDDCHAVLELLARPLPGTPSRALAKLLEHARRPTARIYAQDSPYDLKHVLKARRYRWNDGSDGRPRSWYVDVDVDNRDAELEFLRQEIYQRDVVIEWREITALERFSSRVYTSLYNLWPNF